MDEQKPFIFFKDLLANDIFEFYHTTNPGPWKKIGWRSYQRADGTGHYVVGNIAAKVVRVKQ